MTSFYANIAAALIVFMLSTTISLLLLSIRSFRAATRSAIAELAELVARWLDSQDEDRERIERRLCHLERVPPPHLPPRHSRQMDIIESQLWEPHKKEKRQR